MDLFYSEQIKKEDIEEFIRANKMKQFFISAKTCDNISYYFNKIISEILGIKNNEFDFDETEVGELIQPQMQFQLQEASNKNLDKKEIPVFENKIKNEIEIKNENENKNEIENKDENKNENEIENNDHTIYHENKIKNEIKINNGNNVDNSPVGLGGSLNKNLDSNLNSKNNNKPESNKNLANLQTTHTTNKRNSILNNRENITGNNIEINIKADPPKEIKKKSKVCLIY